VNTCKTCKWWQHEWTIYKGWKHCMCPKHNVWYENLPSDGVLFGKHEPHDTDTLAVGPDFGCIHHEHGPFVEVSGHFNPDEKLILKSLGFKEKA